MKTDLQLKSDVTAELAWDPAVNATNDVEVTGTVVTLKGQVNSMSEHEAAIGTAYGARGVTRVVDQLEVTA